jgi:TonB family protein
MSSWVISALLLVTPLGISSHARSVSPVPFQLQPSFKGYGDGPRINTISRLHIIEALSAKFLLKKVEPEYPPEATATGFERDVVFRIIIGRDGRVTQIHLRRGEPLLIKAAAKAVSKWQYRPYMFNGNAVEVETFATVHFRLPR